MRDVAYCSGVSCELRERCQRYLWGTQKDVVFDEMRTWVFPPYDATTGECELFWPADPEQEPPDPPVVAGADSSAALVSYDPAELEADESGIQFRTPEDRMDFIRRRGKYSYRQYKRFTACMPTELYERMKAYHINWGEVFRTAVEAKLEEFERHEAEELRRVRAADAADT